AYLAKYDADGNQLWIRQFGTSGEEEVGGIAVDASGVYATFATWVFAKQNYIASLRKYSQDGNLLWTRDFDGLAYWSIPVAADGNSVYLAATTGQNGTPWANGGSFYPFLRAYGRDGMEEWTQRFAAKPGQISGLAVDGSAVYVTMEGFSVSGNYSSVRKYDTGGNELWSSPLGALGDRWLTRRAVAADRTGV